MLKVYVNVLALPHISLAGLVKW